MPAADSRLVCAITGATGYVGSRIAEAVGRVASVVKLSRNPSSPADIRWSLNEPEDIGPALRSHRVSVLVHVAWDFSAVHPAVSRRVNVEGSRTLLRMAQAAGVQRIIFISTISAFHGARSWYGRHKLEVEAMTAAAGGVILRPGLVYGDSPGGMFGSMRAQVRRSRFIPMIGNGQAPQFLVPEESLSAVVVEAVLGKFDGYAGAPITIAHPAPVPFRELVRGIARSQGRRVTLVPIPWRILYAALRTCERIGCKAPFRSDSVISFVYQDAHPDFAPLQRLHIEIPPYRSQ